MVTFGQFTTEHAGHTVEARAAEQMYTRYYLEVSPGIAEYSEIRDQHVLETDHETWTCLDCNVTFEPTRKAKP